MTLAASACPADLDLRPHGELDCIDAEAILAETTTENRGLRTDNAVLAEANSALRATNDLLLAENRRLISLANSYADKYGTIADDRDSLAEQVDMLTEEYMAVEESMLPEGTVTYEALTDSEVTAAYRATSRICRGPVPPAIREAVAATTEIRDAMSQAKSEALLNLMRREVRRRRRAQSRSTPRRRATRVSR